MPDWGPLGSVEAFQERETLLQPTTAAVRFAGTEGGVVSPLPAKADKLEKAVQTKRLNPTRKEPFPEIKSLKSSSPVRKPATGANDERLSFSMSVASRGLCGSYGGQTVAN